MRLRIAPFVIAVAAVGAGAALWWSARPPPLVSPPTISGAALYAVTFRDAAGRDQPLGQFQGKTVVINFWATWCAPCREEMPGFQRLQGRWRDRGVAFVGVSGEPPETIARFGRELGIDYALWSGGEEAEALATRLGNAAHLLPFTAVLDGAGRVVRAKVGPYTEAELDAVLAETASNHR